MILRRMGASNVAVARAKARAVGVMVAGWGGVGWCIGSGMGDFREYW